MGREQEQPSSTGDGRQGRAPEDGADGGGDNAGSSGDPSSAPETNQTDSQSGGGDESASSDDADRQSPSQQRSGGQESAGKSDPSTGSGSSERSADPAGGGESSSGENAGTGDSAGRSSGDGDQASDGAQPPQSEGAGSSSGGAGRNSSGSGSGEAGESPPPEPPDMEYTREATDMVLDYLDQTRESPDPDLLDRLDWDEQDLQRFRQRWQDVKPIGDDVPPASEMSPDVQEALRSLGMRPEGGGGPMRQQDAADSLRRLRDAGNRRTAPQSVRDAFEAFQRGLSSPGSSSR